MRLRSAKFARAQSSTPMARMIAPAPAFSIATSLPKRLAATLVAALTLAPVLISTRAHAAPPWVERGLTLPRHVWAFDFGLGLARSAAPNVVLPAGSLFVAVPGAPSRFGTGLNFDFGVGLTQDLFLGARGGIRFGEDGRVLRADQGGRLFDTETYGTGNDTFANPEVDLRWRFVDGEVGEVGLETRAYLPFEAGTRFGVMAALPVALHFGRSVRLDTGVYVPILFYDQVRTVVSFPARLWIQADPRVFLGPISAVHIRNPENFTDLLLGFGFGYSLARIADLKLQFLFPTITETQGARNFNVGVGVEVRIE